MARQRNPEKIALSHRVQRLLGANIREARRKSVTRISQDELATALGISRTSVSNIERGRHRVFLDQVYAAANKLGVTVEYLLPTMNKIFPEQELLTAPHARLTKQSVRELTQLTKEIQQRGATQFDDVTAKSASTERTQ